MGQLSDAELDAILTAAWALSFGSFPPGAVITTNVDQEVSPDAENLARLRERSPDLDGRGSLQAGATVQRVRAPRLKDLAASEARALRQNPPPSLPPCRLVPTAEEGVN
jgi:hypothetical protein